MIVPAVNCFAVLKITTVKCVSIYPESAARQFGKVETGAIKGDNTVTVVLASGLIFFA